MKTWRRASVAAAAGGAAAVCVLMVVGQSEIAFGQSSYCTGLCVPAEYVDPQPGGSCTADSWDTTTKTMNCTNNCENNSGEWIDGGCAIYQEPTGERCILVAPTPRQIGVNLGTCDEVTDPQATSCPCSYRVHFDPNNTALVDDCVTEAC